MTGLLTKAGLFKICSGFNLFKLQIFILNLMVVLVFLSIFLSYIWILGISNTLLKYSSEPYWDVYCNLYYFLALSEEMSATDKWAGFVLTKDGEEFVEQNARLFKYDLLYNPLRFESWERLANIYDEVTSGFVHLWQLYSL